LSLSVGSQTLGRILYGVLVPRKLDTVLENKTIQSVFARSVDVRYNCPLPLGLCDIVSFVLIKCTVHLSV
jgi:hypothetical protein